MNDNNMKSLLERLHSLLGPMSTFYDGPPHLVRAEGVRACVG